MADCENCCGGGTFGACSRMRYTDPTIIRALDVLAKDASATVRYPIARYATWIHKTHPDKMWEWIEMLSQDEHQCARCLRPALDQLSRLDATRSLTLIDRILGIFPRIGREWTNSPELQYTP